MREAVFAKLRESQVSADVDVVVNLYAQFGQRSKVLLEYRFRQAVLGNHAANHAAGIRVFLENFDIEAASREFDRGGHTARPGADNCGLLPAVFNART